MKRNIRKNTKESLDNLVDLITKLNASKHSWRLSAGAKEPTFTPDEVRFIVTLIFEKSKDLAFISTLDHISQNYFYGAKFLNTCSLRRIQFFRHFILANGNATKAAIMAGYSPKTAKQQGYRILRYIRAHQNNAIDD